MTEPQFPHREAWLTALAKELEPLIKSRAGLSRKPYKIACGWPSRRGTSHKHRRIGECWTGEIQGRAGEIFISPTLDNAVQVADVTLHELLHAFLPAGVGHRKPFSQAAKKVGLDGEGSKPTATVPNEELVATLREITDKLGPYPHEKIDLGGPTEKQRNLKFHCLGCGYIGRSSAFWLDTVGPPICPQCMEQMVQALEGDATPDPLELLNQVQEFRIKGDERFSIRMISSGRHVQWFVIDYDPEENSAKIMACRINDRVEIDMTPVSFVPVAARLTPAESRQDALDLIEALRAGLVTYEMLEIEDDIDVEDPLGGENDPADDQEDLIWLDDDEEEVEDNPDSVRLFAHESEAPDYNYEQHKREAA